MASDATIRCDLAIAGGGLAGGLAALAVKARHPQADVRIIEPGERIGGHHLWSYFDTDVDAVGTALLAPLLTRTWPAHDVLFPARARMIATGYNSIASERLDTAVRAVLGDAAIIRATATHVSGSAIMLDDGRRVEARAALDARGAADWAPLACGWQKFVGQMIRTAAPHGVERPVIMDATVDQHDGYRFVYLLPFGPDEIFVEDTYYSDDPALDVAALDARIADYAAARGWAVAAVLRREQGVLPVVKGGDGAAFRARMRDAPDSALIGSRAGLFQPVTSYSLPDAVRAALLVADAWPLDGPVLAERLERATAAAWRGARFYRLLNRMLFDAATPERRYRVLEHFYRLPRQAINRFYAGRSTLSDRARILSGRPPVPIVAALRAMIG